MRCRPTTEPGSMLRNSSFRSLERLCRTQAALTTNARTRRVLEDMATEYRRRACHEEYEQEQAKE